MQRHRMCFVALQVALDRIYCLVVLYYLSLTLVWKISRAGLVSEVGNIVVLMGSLCSHRSTSMQRNTDTSVARSHIFFKNRLTNVQTNKPLDQDGRTQ